MQGRSQLKTDEPFVSDDSWIYPDCFPHDPSPAVAVLKEPWQNHVPSLLSQPRPHKEVVLYQNNSVDVLLCIQKNETIIICRHTWKGCMKTKLSWLGHWGPRTLSMLGGRCAFGRRVVLPCKSLLFLTKPSQAPYRVQLLQIKWATVARWLRKLDCPFVGLTGKASSCWQAGTAGTCSSFLCSTDQGSLQ